MELKFIKRGAALGLTLVVLHKFLAMADMTNAAFPLFFVITLLFLLSGKIEGLLISGFTGLFTLLGAELILGVTGISRAVIYAFTGISRMNGWLPVYTAGFFGSMLAAVTGAVLTVMKFSITPIEIGEVSDKRRAALLLYCAVTAVSFGFTMLSDSAGIGVLCFACIQLAAAAFLIADKTRLLWFAPVLVIAANPLVSASDIWIIPNLAVVLLISGLIVSDVTLAGAAQYLMCSADRIYTACANISIVFRGRKVDNAKKGVIRRFLLALLITLPFAVILIFMLSRIDMIFSNIVKNLTLEWGVRLIVKVFVSIIAAMFFSALMYTSGFSRERPERKKRSFNPDLLIVNTFLTVIVAIYALFAAVQFKYLFAGGAGLPYGLSYTQYARRGFFELLALTGVNILIILIMVRITISSDGMWKNITKALLCGLCAVTVIMLASSFYRMYLYSADDGLTRLRLMVFGFLIFEALSLIVTFAYIIYPKFSITAVYLAAGLAYYCLLNIAPVDRFVARNQVERYLAGETSGLEYVLSLSADAAPEIELLIDGGDPYAQYEAREYMKDRYDECKNNGIFSYCIAEHRLRNICEKHGISDANAS